MFDGIVTFIASTPSAVFTASALSKIDAENANARSLPSSGGVSTGTMGNGGIPAMRPEQPSVRLRQISSE